MFLGAVSIATRRPDGRLSTRTINWNATHQPDIMVRHGLPEHPASAGPLVPSR
ncbi:MAG: hypothetical protein ACRDQ4_11795 [Pseudonocardiaceae bacterium]